jgi:hypothetical protein
MQLNLISIFFFTLISLAGTGAHPIVVVESHMQVHTRAQRCDGNLEQNEVGQGILLKDSKKLHHHSSSTAPPTSPSLPSSSGSNSPVSLFPFASTSIHTLSSTDQRWSVSKLISNNLPLSDSTLRAFNIEQSLQYSYGTAPDGRESLEVTYPEGTAALNGQDDTPPGGVSFYAPGPENVDVTTAKEITFGYSVLFEEGFEFHLGGKLPGIYGGDDPEGSLTCSGGRHSDACFSARFMWRTDGEGEQYLYLPSPERFPANKRQCTVVPDSHCNEDYGNSIGRGLIQFKSGVRSILAQRIRLNDVGKSNGELQVWQDGVSIFELDGIVFRQGAEGRIRGIQMQSFFGGHGPEWVSPKRQKSYLGDFSLAIVETL